MPFLIQLPQPPYGLVIILPPMFKQMMFYQQANFANLKSNMKGQSVWYTM